MKITKYKSFYTEKEFDTKIECTKYDASRCLLQIYFNKLVEMDFFSKFNIKPIHHNVEINNLGKPTAHSWKHSFSGYVRMAGRMGNSDTVVKFKLRSNKFLLILIGHIEENDFTYLTKIPVEILKMNDKTFLKDFISNYNATPGRKYQEYLVKREQALNKLTIEDKKILNLD